MALVQFAPQQFALLAVAGLLAVLWLLVVADGPLSRFTVPLGILAFDRFEVPPERRRRRQRHLYQAHTPVTYRQYAAETSLQSVLAGAVAGIVGIYVMWVVLAVLSTPPVLAGRALPDAASGLAALFGYDLPTGLALFAHQVVFGLVFGLGAALSVYYYRWLYPQYVADERARQIDMSLPMTVSFVYALSQSGMPFPKMMRILADNEHVYGHPAQEMGVAVRNIDVFGMDVITAVQTMARRTSSSNFRDFADNLASVLQTGGSLSEFLHREYQGFQEEAEVQQERLLDIVETLAEIYVTLGVVGPLFLVVILTVIGIVLGQALAIIQLVVYAIIPLGNLAFIVYLSTVVDNLSRRDPTEEEIQVDLSPAGVRRRADLALERGRSPAAADGGTTTDVRETLGRLRVYKQYREVRRRLGSPVRTIVRRPTALLWVTFPVAVFFVGIRIPAQLADGVLTVGEFDDLVIQSLLFLFGTFAVAYWVHRRRIRAIESSIPDFLKRMASLNEAGMTVVDSFDRIRETELGKLDEELEVVWRDIQWGADVETALKRFESRVRTKTVSRIVTLTTEAMKASGNLGQVLRIAADQAVADRRLKAERRQEMFTYLVVVYIAFFVFLFIVGVLDNVLIPSLPETTAPRGGQTAADIGAATPRRVNIPIVSQLGQIDKAAYKRTFVHAAIVQGAFSGLIAGQLSAGDLRAGAKHVTILVATGYVGLVLFL